MSAAALAAAGVISAALTASWSLLLRARAVQWGVVDVPNERSSHDAVRPKGAGVGLAVGSVTGVILLAFLNEIGVPATVWILLAAGIVLMAVGFIDDRHELPVPVRLTVQFALVGVVVGGAVAVSGGTSSLFVLLLVLVAVVGVVAATNIYNFMDGIDGIAAGTGFAVAVTWGFLGWRLDLPVLVALGWAVGAACLAFLWFNWAPADVFMGDSGSLFLGFNAAAIPVLLVEVSPPVALASALPLVPFLVDGTLTIVRRAIRGEALTRAHRSHVYQDAAVEYGHGPVSAVYSGLALSFGLGGFLLVGSPWQSYAFAGVAILTSLGLWVAFRMRRRFSPSDGSGSSDATPRVGKG